MAPKKQAAKKAATKKALPKAATKTPKKAVPPPAQKKRKGTDDPGYNFAPKLTPIEKHELSVAATQVHPTLGTEDPGYNLAFDDLTPASCGTEDPGYNEVPPVIEEELVSQARDVLREAICTTQADADEGTEDPGYNEFER